MPALCCGAGEVVEHQRALWAGAAAKARWLELAELARNRDEQRCGGRRALRTQRRAQLSVRLSLEGIDRRLLGSHHVERLQRRLRTVDQRVDDRGDGALHGAHGGKLVWVHGSVEKRLE